MPTLPNSFQIFCSVSILLTPVIHAFIQQRQELNRLELTRVDQIMLPLSTP